MSLHCQRLSLGKHSFHMLILLLQGNNLLEAPAANLDLCLQETVHVPLSWNGLLAQRWNCSHCQTLTDRQCSFWMLNQLKLLNNVPEPLSCNLCGSPARHTVILPFIESGNLAPKGCSSHYQTVRGRWPSFWNFTLLTLLHKVLDPLASNINNFLPRASELLPFSSKGWCCTKVPFLIPEHTEW
jgi:hypothetical protein